LYDCCPNCNALVRGPYCAQCGQETAIGIPTLREMGHEYVQTFVSLDGRLWRTLWYLVCQPGKLTNEFLAGRRRRYVRPLPLYLSLSFLFFLIFSFGAPNLVQLDSPDPSQSAAQVQRDETDGDITLEGNVPAWMGTIAEKYRQSLKRFKDDPAGYSKKLSEAFMVRLPTAVFFMVPFFALCGKLVYFRRRRAFTEHLLFALHFHAFVFLGLLIVKVLFGDQAGPGFMFFVWGYLALALRAVFGGRLIVQAIRALLLLLMHGLALVLAMVLVLAAIFASV
jgi:hypothetical protein